MWCIRFTNAVENYNIYHVEVKMKLKVGKRAPDFTLPCHLGKDVTLSDLRGMTVVIAFFPLAWTPI